MRVLPISAGTGVISPSGLKNQNIRNDVQNNNFSNVQNFSRMPLGNVYGIRISPSFTSKLQTFLNSKDEIRQGLKELGKDEMVLIMHGGSFPATPETDTGFGSPNSSGARELIDFMEGVFTGIQLGPGGKTKSSDSSPYTSTLFSSNPLFVDLEQLTTKKWGNILPKEVFNNVVENNSNKNKAETNYSYIYEAQDKALRVAYNKFLSSKSPVAAKLRREFEDYKNAEENSPWLDNDALYEALSKKHNMDYWPNWDDELDKRLMHFKDTPEGRQRIDETRALFGYEIDFYKFTQFLYSKQMSETKEYANSKGIKLIADKQVAFSDRDVWAYQDLFLDGWNLGCPPDNPYNPDDRGQTWGFPVVNPDKLFNKDGSLGEAGELLKKSITKIFKENDALRIDHYLGLVDPWVYPSGRDAKLSSGAGRLYSSPHTAGLSDFSIINDGNIDYNSYHRHGHHHTHPVSDFINPSSLSESQLEKYSLYIDKIVLDAIRDAIRNDKNNEGLSDYEIEKKARNAIIAEDLGAMTAPARIVMHKMGLNGIKVTQYMDGRNPDSPYIPTSFNNNGEGDYWYMAGSHDTPPVSVWAKRTVQNAHHDGYASGQIEYIANYLYRNTPEYDRMKEKMYQDPKFLMQSVYAMMLKSPARNIQVFFPDLFGDERIYNTPGTPSDQNWKVRAGNDFQKQYGTGLENNTAFDFIKSIETAKKSRQRD